MQQSGPSAPLAHARESSTHVPGVPGRAKTLGTRLRRRFFALRAAVRTYGQRYVANESQHLFALTLLVGVVCGLVAVAFHLAIRAAEHMLIDRALRAESPRWMVWTIVTPCAGGLLAGVLLTWLVPGARGSGIPQVKQAFAVEGGRIRVRDALGKFFVGALQIGSGASLGREGPTVQICAGAASLLARATSLPLHNMRRLTPVGVAAGIAAAFNAPIAAVTFTIEEIVGTLDQAILSGVVVAAALAAVIERGILGVQPVFEVHQVYGLEHATSLFLYALLGILAAFVSIAFTDGLLKLRMWFRRWSWLPVWAHPAVGGAVTGALAVLALHVLHVGGINGGGYETLGLALAGELGVGALSLLCFAKLAATVFSYSSGGAGGIFAPALFIGAMLGGAVGHLDMFVLGHQGHELGAFALVGMGAVFAGIIRAPITSVLIIFEMTGGYGLVLPLMLANATAYMLARRLRPVPVYEALLAQDGVVLPHGAPAAHALDRLSVEDAMTTDVVRVLASQTIQEARAAVDASRRSFAALPVLAPTGGGFGLVPIAKLRNATLDPTQAIATLMHVGATIPADAPLLRAVVMMNDLGVRQLLVVDAPSESLLVGVLTMTDLVRAHARAALPTKRRVRAAPRTEQRLELRADTIMLPAAVVPATAGVPELSTSFGDESTKALIVSGGTREYGVIVEEYLNDFAHDEDLKRILLAADIAHPAPSVKASTSLPELAEVMAANGIDAAVVLDASPHEQPIGVVTKSALVAVFLEWYVNPPKSPVLRPLPVPQPCD